MCVLRAQVSRKKAATSLESNQYCRVLDSSTGRRWVVKGEALLFPEPTWELQGGVQSAISLKKTEYVRLIDETTGAVRVERGEQMVFPEVYLRHRKAHNVANSLRLRTPQPRWGCGARELFHPPSRPTARAERRDAASATTPRDHRRDRLSARLTSSPSAPPCVSRAGSSTRVQATEAVLNKEGKLTAINLKIFEYVRVLDSATGVQRVIQGSATVFLGATEEAIDGGKKAAIEVDRETAVRIRNKRTGELQLVTEAGLFFPRAEEEILEVQQLVKLNDYECMIIANSSGERAVAPPPPQRRRAPPGGYSPQSWGRQVVGTAHTTHSLSRTGGSRSSSPLPSAGELSFYYGDDAKRGDTPRAFFIPPHHSAYELTWSRGRRREKRDLRLTCLDVRPQFMSFEFNCRTSDNVELVLEGTFFWQIVDVKVVIGERERHPPHNTTVMRHTNSTRKRIAATTAPRVAGRDGPASHRRRP